MNKDLDRYDLFFTEIYEHNYAYIVKYISIYVHDFSIAEDLAHDVFLKVYRSGKAELDGGKMRNYIKKAAKNMVIDYGRRCKREEAKNRRIISEVAEINTVFCSDVENIIIEGEVISTLKDVIDNFSERSRRVFHSRLLDRESRKEVSEKEKMTFYEVKKVEEEIIRKLREKLKQYF